MENILVDKYGACKDCGNEFLISKGEQEFLRGLVEKQTPRNDGYGNQIEGSEMKEFKLPVRCKECRQKRKAFFNSK